MRRKIGIGIAGYGGIAKTHLLAFKAMEVLFPTAPFGYAQTLCTRNAANENGVLFDNVVTDYHDLLQDPLVEIVDICSPNFAHFDQARAAIAAGKTIYMEKPLTDTLQTAKELATLAKKQHTKSTCALVYRFVPGINAVKDLLDSGALGEIIHFRLNLYHHSYLDPNRPTSWRQQFSTSGGGAIMDLGVHFIDIVRYLMGDIEQVFAQSKTVNKERFTDDTRTEKIPNDTDEYMSVMLKMKRDCIGMLEVSRISQSDGNGALVEIFGTKGSLKLSEDMKEVTHCKGSVITKYCQSLQGPFETYNRSLTPPEKLTMGTFQDCHIASLKNLLLMHTEGKVFPGTPTFEDAYEAQKVVTSCLRSVEEQQPVSLSQKSESFA